MNMINCSRGYKQGNGMRSRNYSLKGGCDGRSNK